MLELHRISKSFPGVKALDNVCMKINKGEVHALVGENGAGKSTLMNILSGNLHPDSGKILIDGQEIRITSAKHARQTGINIVYQERSLVDKLSVAENIFPDRQPKNFLGWIDRRRLHRLAKDLLDRLKISDIDTNTLVEQLSPGKKQMVEIAKALAFPCQILILDEPTASITYNEISTLFNIIRDLKGNGVAIIYISHRMDEIKDIADVISVLKDGKHQGTMNADTISIDEIIKMMVGRELKLVGHDNYAGDVVMELRNLTGHHFRNVSFSIRKGEIFGLSGLVGSGRTEIARAIIGEGKIVAGEIYKNKRKFLASKSAEAIGNAIVYVPEERITMGIFAGMSIEENIMISHQKGVFRDARKWKNISEKYISVLNIKAPDRHALISELSGGNQQKVVLARWLSVQPEILIVDEPTHGVDIGSKFEIYELFNTLRKNGLSVLLISSDLPEILMLSDRIAVMHRGELKKILNRSDATEQLIMHYASGLSEKN